MGSCSNKHARLQCQARHLERQEGTIVSLSLLSACLPSPGGEERRHTAQEEEQPRLGSKRVRPQPPAFSDKGH